jgi:predicted GNAT family N-acyltransferase
MSKKYIFREITEKDELEKFFHFRYEVYSGCQCKSVLKSNEQAIDIDYYDVHSKHYALSCENSDAGYFRVVMPREELKQNSIIEIASKNGVFSDYDKYKGNGAAPFPFLSYKEVPQSYWGFYENLIARNETLAECSRLILTPESRTLRTSRFLIECAIAMYLIICFGKKQAVLSCNVKHKSFYEYYGFEAIGKENGFSIYGYDSVAMSLTSLPAQIKTNIEDMSDEFTTTKKIIKAF